MGCPISRFSTLCDLANNQYVKQSFEQFKQIAIVLNDPRNLHFNKIMQKNFEGLDKETGKSFLFLSFIKRPYGWQPGYDPIDDGKKVLAADLSTNETSMMYSFCQRADITTHNLPKILLLKDLDATEYVALPTDTKNVCDHLVAIGQFCDEQDESISTDQMAQFLKSKMHGQPLSIGMTAEPISTILADLYAVAETKSSMYYHNAQRWQNEANERLYNNYQNASPDKKEQALFNWMDYTAYCEKNKREKIQEPSPQLNLQIPLEWIKGCEYECKNYITWFNELSRKSLRNRLYNIPTDTTLYSRYLTKFVEIELNRSLVQHMRQVLGIPMPEYYCTYYETKHPNNYIIQLNNYDVSLNSYHKNHDDKYLINVSPLSLIRAYQEMLNTRYNNNINLNNYGQGFINIISQIAPSRNIGEHHDDLFSNVDIKQMYEAFICFLREYFPHMVELKKQLRPRYR